MIIANKFVIIKFMKKIENLPKNILMYWENINGSKKPSYLELCFKTVKKYCSKKFLVLLDQLKTAVREQVIIE